MSRSTIAEWMLTRCKGRLKLKDWAFDRQAIDDAKGESRSGSPPRDPKEVIRLLSKHPSSVRPAGSEVRWRHIISPH
jgi:hypothetical protein